MATTNPEFEKAMRMLRGAEASLIDAVCITAGYPKRHPLRKVFRSAFRGLAKRKGGKVVSKKVQADIDLIVCYERLRLRTKTGENPRVIQHEWDDALLDWANAKK